jgi:hypothetical protein
MRESRLGYTGTRLKFDAYVLYLLRCSSVAYARALQDIEDQRCPSKCND